MKTTKTLLIVMLFTASLSNLYASGCMWITEVEFEIIDEISEKQSTNFSLSETKSNDLVFRPDPSGNEIIFASSQDTYKEFQRIRKKLTEGVPIRLKHIKRNLYAVISNDCLAISSKRVISGQHILIINFEDDSVYNLVYPDIDSIAEGKNLPIFEECEYKSSYTCKYQHTTVMK